MRCGTLDWMSYQQLRKLHKKGNESKSANQTHRNCREGSKPDRTSCAMDCGPPTHCCCSSLPWHRAKYQLDKDHWNQAPKPSSLGRCSMCSKAQHSTAQHSTAQHSTAQHQSCPVKVSGRQMIASRMCRTHHCSAAISAVVLTACCQCQPVCNLRRSHCKCMQAGRLLLSSTKGELQLDGCVPFGSTSRHSSNSMIHCCPSCT